MFAGLLSRLPGPSPACETMPNLVASTTSSRRPFERPADEFLVGVRAVDLGGVDQGDAEVERAVDGADGFGVVGAGAGVRERHAHGAEADPGDVQVSELDVLHVDRRYGRLDRPWEGLSLPGSITWFDNARDAQARR